MKGLARWEKNIILTTPMLALLLVGTIFYFLFKIYEDIGSWVLDELGSVPFLVWVPVGGVLGYVLYRVHEKKRKILITYSKRIFLGLIGWLFLSIIVSLMTGEGDLFHRLDEGPLFKAWAALAFVLLSLSPTMFGTFSVFTRKRWAIGATVSVFFLLALVCMIFSQARSATILDQDPLLSLLFVWGIIAYVEGINWTKRYIDRDTMEFPDTDLDKDISAPLLRRQISYTFIIIGIASIFAYLPLIVLVVFDGNLPGPLSWYEARTIFGLELLGLLILTPLMLFAVIRRRLDVRRTEKQNGPENGKP
jgi:hypothetical protein